MSPLTTRLFYVLTANLTLLAAAWCASQATGDPALTLDVALPGSLLVTLLVPHLFSPPKQ